MPEVIPLGIFAWSIQSMTNRTARRIGIGTTTSASAAGANAGAAGAALPLRGRFGKEAKDMYQLAAERAFQKQREYFSYPKRVPYPLQGDIARMSNKRDETKHGQDERLRGFSLHMQQASGKKQSPHEKRKAKDGDDEREEDAEEEKDRNPSKLAHSSHGNNNTAAYHRQRLALQRQTTHPWDD